MLTNNSTDSEGESSASSIDSSGKNYVLDQIITDLTNHPAYLDDFIKTHNFILRGDGPLPWDVRYIIAILAVGRHQCCCMMNWLRSEYLHYGGNRAWLAGLSAIPPKIQKIYTINKILAHRPWCIETSHFKELTKGDNSWSLSELVHAIVILVYFHGLSSFVYACGINKIMRDTLNHECELKLLSSKDEKDLIDKEASSSTEPTDLLKTPPKQTGDQGRPPLSPCSPPSVVGEQEVKVVTLVERMRGLREKSVEITPEELSKRFQTIEQQTAELKVAPKRRRVPKTDIGVFIADIDYIYKDFATRDARGGHINSAPTFRIQDYSWDDHGFSLVNDLYSDIGILIDEKFKTAINLTYHTMGQHSPVDTSRFRIAIWNYIQCLYGIRHDDYDYNEVNQLLERSLKTFIKNAVCYPERVTFKDYERVMTEFDYSEKIHLNLMILEARMQGELLYALRNMVRYMTSNSPSPEKTS